MSLMESDEEHRWVPTHAQVTVLRARGLRAKGKHGTSDVYTIIQLGKEKYSTCLMEKTTDPEWGEECSFELQPGILKEGGRDAYPPGSADLTLTVMHRALIGLDVFLGQAVIPLDKAFQEKICKKSQWYRLHSKTGKKEKERGELQLNVQFTRHNLTASMYDLSVKDKPRSAFDKLRERMRVKKRTSEEDSSSAIVAGGYGSLVRIRARLPSDGGGEEEYEDDEGGEARRSKMRSFFLRGKLRRSSDTRSSTSLGSESSESSSRGGSLSPTAGISVVVSDLSNSPSNSSNLTADSPDHTVAPSPQVSPVRHVYAHEIDFSLPVPHSVMSENNTLILLPSVYVNGNPVETSPLTHHPPSIILQQPQPESTKLQARKLPDEPQTTRSTEPKSQTSAETKLCKSESKPRPEPQLPALGLIQKGSSHSLSLQNLSRRGEEKRSGGPVDGRRWSFDKPGEEEKAAIVAALECAGRVTDESVMETVIPVGETETLSKKRRGLFSHGKGESAGKGPITSKEEAEHAQQLVEVKHKGWFGSKDSHSKPSSLVSSRSDSSSSVICPIDPSQNMADKHANPFTSPPPLLDANPFFPLAQPNPFFQEFPSDASLTPSLSSSAQYQSEPASSWSGGNPTPDLLRIGNGKGPSGISQIDFSIDASISHFVDEADFGIFAEDRLKSSEKGKETENMVTTPTVLVKPKNEEPLGGLDSLTDTNDLTYLEKTASAGTTTGEMSKEISANTPQVSGSDGNSNKSDLTSPDLFGFPEFNPNFSEIILPENSSLEFSALNALAWPYPALSNVQNNEVNGDTMTPKDWPDMCLTSQNAKPSFTQPSLLDDIFNTKLMTIELSDDAHVSPEEPEFGTDIESVEMNEDPVPCCRDSDDALEPSSETSDSQGRELDNQSVEPGHFPHCDFISSIKQSDEGVLDSDASLVESSETLGFHSPSAPSSPVAIPLDNEDNLGADMETKFENESEEGLSDSANTSDLFSEITFPIPDNLNDISFSFSNTVSNEVHVDEQKVFEFPNNPSKDDLIGSVFFSTGEGQEIIQSDEQTIPAGHLNPTTEDRTGTNEDSLILNSALSPPSVIVHSMHKSADSDQYLTCVSQQDSISPSLELPQELKPKHDQSGEDSLLFGSLPEHITVPDVMPKAVEEMDCVQNQVVVEHFKSQETSPKNECPKGDVQLNNCKPSGDNPESDVPKDMMPKMNISKDLIAELEAQLAPLKTETRPVDNCETNPFRPNHFHSEQTDRCPSETVESLFNLAHANVCVSNCASEETKSITQDLVITDLFAPNQLESPQCNSPVTHPKSAGTHDVLESQSLTMQITHSATPDLFPVNWPLPSAFEPPALASGDNHSLFFPSSAFDPLPVASSTPHVAVDTNAMPQQFPFPTIPSTSEQSWPHPAFNDPFLPENSQTTNHQSSPHPVKPLTPPDDKRSEGRSVLEKLKSTIHSGRSHHSDQDADKKLLVEGGGSYYHLNHSELVNLLIQRDTELKQEREEYQRRGALLEKRDVDLKKMKVTIRDLEDYIDTLLVRIMEQTPTLLQVNPRKK